MAKKAVKKKAAKRTKTEPVQQALAINGGVAVGTALLILADVIELMANVGILRGDGSFDHTQLDELQEDLAFAKDVEVILKRYGLDVPERVDQIIQLLPIVAGIIR